MLEETKNKIKELFVLKNNNNHSNDNTNNKKKIENLVVFIVILIITIIIINVIWKDDKTSKNKNNNNIEDISLAKENTNSNTGQNVNITTGLEEKLEDILQNIEGVGKAKVLLTYSESSKTMAMYNEDNSTSDTEETDTSGGNRKINQSTSKKEVIYQEINGEKVPVTQSVITPKIEGAIITASGAKNSEVKTNIIQAVEAVTGLATYKIQVFEMSI